MSDWPIIVGISGASGSLLARETVDELLCRNRSVALVCSNDAKLVWQQEMGEPFSYTLSRWREDPNLTYYSIGDTSAPIASGSYPTNGMVVVPCSMTSVASIAHGIANNLLLRAADVTLKERRRLVVIPRETPLHTVHLENMTKLSTMGVVILPPEPAFYLNPKTIADVVRFTVGKIIVALGLEDALEERFRYQGGE